MSTHRNKTLRRIKRRLDWYGASANAEAMRKMRKCASDEAWYWSGERTKWLRTMDILYKFRI